VAIADADEAGHKQAMTTARYAHLSTDPLRAANEAVGLRIATIMNAESSLNASPKQHENIVGLRDSAAGPQYRVSR
jgi:hypothetical protein